MRKHVTKLFVGLFALGLLFLGLVANGQSFTETWSVDESANGGGWKHHYRGIAVGNNHLYVAGTLGSSVFNQEDQIVKVIDVYTGEILDTLDNTGITSYGYGIRTVQVSDDGSILAANMTLNAAGGHPVAIWRWRQEDRQPELFTMLKATGRIDMFTVEGDVNGNASIMAGINGATQVTRVVVTDGVIGEEEVVNLKDVGTGSITNVCPVGPLATDQFWYNNTGINPTLFNADGTKVGSIADSIFSGTTGTMKLFSYMDKQYLLVADQGDAKLIDITGKQPSEVSADDVVYSTTTGAENIYQDVDYRIGDIDGSLSLYSFSEANYLKMVATEAAPLVQNVMMTGLTLVTHTSQVSATYVDINRDEQKALEVKWFLSDDKDGTNKTEIESNAGNLEYTYTTEDLNKYVSVKFWASALTGIEKDSANIVESMLYGPIAPADAKAPVATIGDITGDVQVDEILTASYTYADENGDEEGESIIKWYRAENEFGDNRIEVASDTLQYLLQPEDGNKYIIFAVTPVAKTGTLLVGEEAWKATDSAAYYPEFLPEAINLDIAGIEEVTRTLTGSYEFKDLNLDDEEGTSYQTWYRADAVDGTKTITSIESDSYELTQADSGKFVFYGVTPISAEDMLASGTGLYEFDDETDLWKNTAAGKGLNTVMAEGVFKYATDGDVASTEGTDYSFVDGMNGKAVSLKANNWLKVWHGIPANGGGTWVNDFTVVMDVQVSDSNGIYSLLEVNPEGTGNGYTSELEIDSLRLGSVGAPSSGADAFGFSTDSIDINKFYRVTYVAKLFEYIKVYVDGVLVNTIEGDFSNSRPAPYTADRHPEDAAIRLGGNNEVNRDGDKVIDMMAVFGRSLTDTEVAHLGVAGDQAAGNVGVEAFANTGEIQPTPPEGAPEAQNVMVSGTPEVGAILWGSYDYWDYTDDPEGESIYKWYTADDAAGTNATVIEGADKMNYIVSENEIGKFFLFEITPVAQTGGLLEGEPVSDTTLAAAIASTQAVGLDRMWLSSDKTGAIPPYMSSSAITERGFAVGNGDHMYIASRKEGADILVVNKADGELVGKLDMTGVSGGVFPINDVEVSDDGQILGMPLHASTDFWLYKWENELAAPVKWLEATLPETMRFDKFNVTGDLSGDAIVTASMNEGNKICRWVITGGVAGDMEVITVVDQTIGTAPVAVPFSASADAHMLVDGKGIAPIIIDKDGNVLTSIARIDNYNDYKIQSNSPNVFQFKGRTMAAFYQAMRQEPLGARNIIVDITDVSSIQIIDSTEYVSNQQPWYGYLGETDVVVDENNYYVYQMQANFGLGAWIGDIELADLTAAITNWEGTEVYADFSKDLMAASVDTSAAYWTITADGTEIDITSASADANTVTFALASTITEGQAVTLAYDGMGGVSAFDGFEIAAFGPADVENIVGADAPVATDVSIEGTLQTTAEVTGVYTFSDVDGDEEGESMYQWYYADDADGTNMLKVIGGTSITYTIDETLKDKYLAFEVTPVSATGGADYLVGDPVMSDFMHVRGVGVDETFANSVNMYPNPVNNLLTIDNCEAVKTVNVIDYTGRTLMSIDNTGNDELSINMSQLDAGVYIIQLTGANNVTKVQRVVKN